MQALDARTFAAMLHAAADRLASEKERINALNVFPVPDGDTGTNMLLTVESAVREASKARGRHLGEVVGFAARGALMGARGNSGVILSQFFRGFAEALAGLAEASAEQFAGALEASADAAYRAVMEPVEGTMLTVGRAAADAGRASLKSGAAVSAVLDAALAGAREAVSATPRQLQVLRDAGVVDAGGEGLVVLVRGSLEGLYGIRRNGAVRVSVNADSPRREAEATLVAHGSSSRSAQHSGIALADIEFKYCTEFLVHGESLHLEELRSQLAPLGDSLLVVGDSSVVKVHVHTNHPGRALEICGERGDLAEIQIGNMVLQNQEAAAKGLQVLHTSAAAVPNAGTTRPVEEIALVAVSQGEGFSRLLGELGVDCIVPGGQSMNPSTDEILRAVESLPHWRVIVLPNNSNVIMAAKQAASVSRKAIEVVETRSLPEAVAALMGYAGDGELPEVATEMKANAEAVRVGEVTYAVRDAVVDAQAVKAGEVLGMSRGRLIVTGPDLTAAVLELVDRLRFAGAELVTLYYGSDVTQADAEAMQSALQESVGDLEVECYEGGQPLYCYLIAVE